MEVNAVRLLNTRAVLPVILFLALIVPATAFNRLEVDTESIEALVDRTLQKSDLGSIANELASKPSPGNTKDLLIRLSIFGRAGQRSRSHSTLRQLAKANDRNSSPYASYSFNVAQNAIDKDDFEGRKIFYENIALAGDDNVRGFVELWKERNEIAELEKWLKIRALQYETWWDAWLGLKKELGTAAEVYDEMEQKIRQDPSDHFLVKKYLRAIASEMNCSMPPCLPSYKRNISWLAEVVPTDSAYGAYDLAITVRHQNSELAAKLLEKSLSLPYGEKDATLFIERAFRYASVPPVVKNPEKQLRYWTKKALAEIYLSISRPLLAQPLTEDLTAMDTSDIQKDDVFRLAGLTQAASGQRAVEERIIQDEEQKRDSPYYWIDRAKYYQGRNERELEWQAYKDALPLFPCKSNGLDSEQKRFQLLLAMSSNVHESYEEDVNTTLRNEFKLCADNLPYLFLVGRIVTSDRNDLRDELFVNTELLPNLLDSRSKWNREEQYLVDIVMESEAWEPKRRDAVWNKLSELAMKSVVNRAFSLAEAMMSSSDYKRAVPLLEMCRKFAPEIYDRDHNFTREDVERELFAAYIEIGDWRKAEKMFLDGYSYWGNELGQIAVTAAKSGHTADAFRIWKINANLDRRKLAGIEELAKTGAKPMLSDFYLKMKNEDPLSYLPEKAIKLLN